MHSIRQYKNIYGIEIDYMLYDGLCVIFRQQSMVIFLNTIQLPILMRLITFKKTLRFIESIKTILYQKFKKKTVWVLALSFTLQAPFLKSTKYNVCQYYNFLAPLKRSLDRSCSWFLIIRWPIFLTLPFLISISLASPRNAMSRGFLSFNTSISIRKPYPLLDKSKMAETSNNLEEEVWMKTLFIDY